MAIAFISRLVVLAPGFSTVAEAVILAVKDQHFYGMGGLPGVLEFDSGWVY